MPSGDNETVYRWWAANDYTICHSISLDSVSRDTVFTECANYHWYCNAIRDAHFSHATWDRVPNAFISLCFLSSSLRHLAFSHRTVMHVHASTSIAEKRGKRKKENKYEIQSHIDASTTFSEHVSKIYKLWHLKFENRSGRCAHSSWEPHSKLALPSSCSSSSTLLEIFVWFLFRFIFMHRAYCICAAADLCTFWIKRLKCEAGAKESEKSTRRLIIIFVRNFKLVTLQNKFRLHRCWWSCRRHHRGRHRRWLSNTGDWMSSTQSTKTDNNKRTRIWEAAVKLCERCSQVNNENTNMMCSNNGNSA